MSCPGLCNVCAFRYKRILFFYGLPRRGAFRSLRFRLRHCLLGATNCQCCRAPLFSRVVSVYGAARWNAAAHLCCRASVVRAFLYGRAPVLPRSCQFCRAPVLPRPCQCCSVFVLPRSMVPRTCMPPRTHGAARIYVVAQSFVLPWCHARQNTSSSLCLAVLPRIIHSAAQFHVLPRTHGAARGRTLRRLPGCRSVLRTVALRSFVAAKFSLVAAHCRMWPRTVTCCRAPMVPRAAVRFIVYVWRAFIHVSAQFCVLPRSLVPREA